MNFETILFSVDAGIARLTLNRPERLNAFNERMHIEVAEALGRIEADAGVRVLVLTGSGRGFCAGQDLSERNVDAGPLDLGRATAAYYNPLICRVAALKCPVVCAVNGVAAGAGVNIALSCDLVLARQSAKFVQAFSTIGLIPDAGGTWVLPHLIGQARALGFTLTGGTVSAAQAEQWGLIWRAIEDEAFDGEVERLTAQLVNAPTKALAAAKRAIRGAWGATLEDQLALESRMQRDCGLTQDYKEGVNAFKARRPPRFQGR